MDIELRSELTLRKELVRTHCSVGPTCQIKATTPTGTTTWYKKRVFPVNNLEPFAAISMKESFFLSLSLSLSLRFYFLLSELVPR
ncbi:hypothetical protein VNO80_24779 [Phaseolus coccineus]|uniref:Uncharacterized protein n=1 Tax=Phaseolus coccineus TaxID=3886 RepID=A0AAN9QN57_PHACN